MAEQVRTQSRNARTIEAVYDAFNRRDFEAVLAADADECTWTDHPQNQTLSTREEMLASLQGWVDAFSDARVTDLRVYDAGDVIVAQFVGRGTNDGPFGPFEATGRGAAFPVCEVTRFDAEGKVTAMEMYYDIATILQQLGHMPEDGA